MEKGNEVMGRAMKENSALSNWFQAYSKPLSIVVGIILSIMLIFCSAYLSNLSSISEYINDGGVLHTLRVMPYLTPEFMPLMVLPITSFVYLTRRGFERRQIAIGVASLLIASSVVFSQSLIQTHTFATLFSSVFYSVCSILSLLTIWLFVFLMLRAAFYAIVNSASDGSVLSDKSQPADEDVLRCEGSATSEEQRRLNVAPAIEKHSTLFTKKYHLLIVFGILLLAWLPYIIVFLPGSISYDLHFQLLQYIGVAEWSNHHPVITTLIYGSIFSLGDLIGGPNVGLLFMSLFQVIFMAVVLTLEIWAISRLNAPNWVVFVSIGFFALYPIFPCYSDNAVKDILFSILFTLYFTLFILFIKDPKAYIDSPFRIALFLIAALLCGITRNNGLYIVALSLPFLLLFLPNAKARIKMLVPICLTIVLIPTLTSLAMFAVSAKSGSVREALSVPLMQSARSYLEHSEDMSEDELEVLDNTFRLDELDVRYEPYLSDEVKNRYVDESSIWQYLSVWAQQATRYPESYLDAWGELTFGYWSLTIDPTYPIDTFYNYQQNGIKGEIETPYQFTFIASYPFRQVFSQLIEFLLNIPFVVYLMQGGTYTYAMIILAALLIFAKKPRYLVALLPCAGLMLTIMFGPMNGLPRYFLGNICVFPIMIWACFAVVQGKISTFRAGDVLKSARTDDQAVESCTTKAS